MFCTINSQLSTSHQLSTSKAKYKRNTNFRNTISTKALIRPSFLRTNSRSITRTNRIWDQTRQQTPENAWGQACRSDNCSWTPQKPKKKKKHQKNKENTDRITRKRHRQASGGEVDRGGSSRNKSYHLKVATFPRPLRFSFVVFCSFQLRLRAARVDFRLLYIYTWTSIYIDEIQSNLNKEPTYSII